MIDIEGKRVQLTVGKNHNPLAVGDIVTLYLLAGTPVYEQDGFSKATADEIDREALISSVLEPVFAPKRRTA